MSISPIGQNSSPVFPEVKEDKNFFTVYRNTGNCIWNGVEDYFAIYDLSNRFDVKGGMVL